MDRELAEPLAEFHQPVRGDDLVAEDQQLMLGEPVMDRVAVRVGERPGKVDALDLVAEDQQLVLGEPVMDRVAVRVGERLGKIPVRRPRPPIVP